MDVIVIRLLAFVVLGSMDADLPHIVAILRHTA